MKQQLGSIEMTLSPYLLKGGLLETQKMLNFCGEHNITCDIEMIDIKDVKTVYDRTVKGDVRYRFVIDMTILKTAMKELNEEY